MGRVRGRRGGGFDLMMGEGGKRRAGKALMVAVGSEGMAGGTGRLWYLLVLRRNAVGVWRWCGMACLLCSSVDPECHVFEEHICAFGLGPCFMAQRCWLKWNRAICFSFSRKAFKHSRYR